VVLAAILVGPWALFVIVANAMLAFGGIEAIVTRSTPYTTVSLEHGRAWTLWPTRVHVVDARLRIDAYSFELDLQVPEAVVEMHLLDLFDRRVHFERIAASGVRAQYRSKLAPGQLDDPITRAFPWIDGEPPEAQADTPVRRKPFDEAWGIDLDDVDAYVDALWVDEFLTEPCGRVRGGMQWIAGWQLAVPSATVELESARLWIGEHEVAREMWGGGEAELAPLSTWDTPPSQVPRHVGFAVKLQAELRDPSAAELYLPRIAGMVGRGAGEIEVDVTARAGELVPGSRVHYASPSLDFGRSALWVRAAAEATLTISERGQPHAVLELTDARLVSGTRIFGRAEAVSATFTGDHADMTERWRLIAARAQSNAIAIDDLRPLSGLDDDDDWWITGGSARVRGHAEMGPDGVLASRFVVDARRVGVATATTEVEGNASLRGALQASRREGLVVERLHGRIDGVSLRTPKGKSSGSWARIKAAEIRATAGEVVIDLRAELEDARPALIHLTELDPIVKATPELSRLERVKLRARIRMWPRTVEVEVLEAEQMMLEVAGVWRKRDESWRAAFGFDGLAHTGYEGEPGRREIEPITGDAWLRDRKAWVRALGKDRRQN
jgi:hypothetical protein